MSVKKFKLEKKYHKEINDFQRELEASQYGMQKMTIWGDQTNKGMWEYLKTKYPELRKYTRLSYNHKTHTIEIIY